MCGSLAVLPHVVASLYGEVAEVVVDADEADRLAAATLGEVLVKDEVYIHVEGFEVHYSSPSLYGSS